MYKIEKLMKNIKTIQKILRWALLLTAGVLTIMMAKAMKLLFIHMKSEGLL